MRFRALVAVIAVPLSAACALKTPEASGGAPGAKNEDVARPPPGSPASPPTASVSPDRPNAVPVLLFHAVCAGECAPDNQYGTTTSELARTLTAISSAGYTTISPEQYVRFLHGERDGIPKRPILITFDDGRLDAWVGADALFEERGMRATMFVITARADAPGDRFMSWDHIRRAAESGRWDMQLHAAAGHVRIPSTIENGVVVERPAYATRQYRFELAGQEPIDEWRARVMADLDKGNAALGAHVPGYAPWTFAVPFGDYGQKQVGNDPAIARELRAMLDAKFDFWFTQPSSPGFTMPGDGTHERPRFTIDRTTTAEAVSAWLTSRASAPPPPASSSKVTEALRAP